MADHRSRYKNAGLDAKELRRRRGEDSVQLRKQKRDTFLSKRRTMPDDISHGEAFWQGEISEVTASDGPPDVMITPHMIESVMQNDDMSRLLDNAQKIRRILSKEPQPPFDEVTQSGVVSRFVDLLECNDVQIQFEVAWILTNICSGTSEHTRVVVEAGAVPKLMNLVRSPDLRVCEQGIWALGNIIGESSAYRDLVISQGFVPTLLSLIQPDLEVGFLRNATWVIVNLCRSKDPPVDMSVIEQIIPAILLLIQSDDRTILVDTAWAVSYITELGSNHSQLMIDSGIMSKMTPLLTHSEVKIQTAVIRALGCIATGDDDQTQAVIDSGAIPHLRHILAGDRDKTVIEALWMLSNLTAGNANQVQAIIDGGLLPFILKYLGTGEYQQQKEASWTVFNFCLSGKPEQLKILVEEGVIIPLCDLLVIKDLKVVRNALESLSSLLKNCDDDSVREAIEECGGLDKIETLQNSDNQEIYEHAYSIIDKYFATE